MCILPLAHSAHTHLADARGRDETMDPCLVSWPRRLLQTDVPRSRRERNAITCPASMCCVVGGVASREFLTQLGSTAHFQHNARHEKWLLGV